MHFVCSLYASPTAYIFVPSALRTRLFSFLYALYAVFFGVVFSHSMHSRFFSAYNAYKFFDRPSKQRSRWNERNAYTPAGAHDDREARMGRDGSGRPVRRAMKARKSPLSVITGSKESFTVRRGMPEDANSRRYKSRQYKRSRERNFFSFSLYMLVCILYALCMRSQLHTFLASQPYS